MARILGGSLFCQLIRVDSEQKSWPRLTRNQSDVACPNPCHTPRGPCRTLFFFTFCALWPDLCKMGPKSAPGGSKIDPGGSQIGPGGSKIDPGGLQKRPRRLKNQPRRLLGGSWVVLGGSLGVPGGLFIRKLSILEVQNRPKSEVFPYFLKFSDSWCF